MAARRNTTPLFEIVNRNGNASATPAERHDRPGDLRSEPRAHEESEPIASAPSVPRRHVVVEEDASLPQLREPEAARDVPRTMGRMSVASGTVRLPLNYAYVGLSVVLVLALLAWTLGYFVGGRAADEKARREIETATNGPALRDPLSDDVSLDQTTDYTGRSVPTPPESGGSASPASPLIVPAGLPAVTDRRTPYLAPGGYYEAEPRTPGLNYFCLVSRLPESDARSAIDFLARNGVIAVGVEPGQPSANNPVYALYTLEGLTGEEYARRNGSTRRDSHESLLAELGRRWRSDERGTSDFSQPQWYRYRPDPNH